MPDLVLRNARIVTPDSEIDGDIAIADGRIVAIGPDLPGNGSEIDLEGRLVLPGGIDTHCHMNQLPVAGETGHADTFLTATSAAAAGGVTTVMPQSMCPRGGDQMAEFEAYLARAQGQAVIDYSAHAQMPEANPRFLDGGLPDMVARGFGAIKLFTTYEGYALSDAEILAIFDAAARHRALCLVHAEDDAMVRHARAALLASGRTALPDFALARPAQAEAEMIHRIASYALMTGARVHVYHVSGKAGLDQVAAARARGAAISAETCVHYLCFTDEDLARPDFEGAKFLCAPPLRGPRDREALWQALADGTLSLVSSDHSPSRRQAQIAQALARRAAGETVPFTAFSGGFPGLQMLMPALFSEGVAAGRINLRRFVQLTAEEPARLFGLADSKGRIAVGADADLVVWEPMARWVVRQEDMLSGVDFTPWEGMQMTGRPVMTYCRGRLVARDGRIVDGAQGHGRPAPRMACAL